MRASPLDFWNTLFWPLLHHVTLFSGSFLNWKGGEHLQSMKIVMEENVTSGSQDQGGFIINIQRHWSRIRH